MSPSFPIHPITLLQLIKKKKTIQEGTQPTLQSTDCINNKKIKEKTQNGMKKNINLCMFIGESKDFYPVTVRKVLHSHFAEGIQSCGFSKEGGIHFYWLSFLFCAVPLIPLPLGNSRETKHVYN